MSSYGAYDLEHVLDLSLTSIRRLCKRVQAREMRRVHLNTIAYRNATNADGKDFQSFLNCLEVETDAEEDQQEKGEFLDPGHFEIRHE